MTKFSVIFYNNFCINYNLILELFISFQIIFIAICIVCASAYGPKDDDSRGGYNRHESNHGKHGSLGHQTQHGHSGIGGHGHGNNFDHDGHGEHGGHNIHNNHNNHKSHEHDGGHRKHNDGHGRKY